MIVKVIILLLLLLHTATVEGKDAVEGNIPMVHLLGVQKGGSSSLFEFMIQHPLVLSLLSSLSLLSLLSLSSLSSLLSLSSLSSLSLS